MKEDLSKIVNVSGDGVASWDGKEYDLSTGATVALGIAKRWQEIGYTLTVSDAPVTTIPPRDIVNPLADETKGKAFQGLKRGPKPKEG